MHFLQHRLTPGRGRIATDKIPRYWKIVDSFPMTITGKIRKFRMRQIAIAELGLAIATASRWTSARSATASSKGRASTTRATPAMVSRRSDAAVVFSGRGCR